ncbi:MAG: hypothetical protein WD316_12885 [Phycisphaeraceae bacterium]
MVTRWPMAIYGKAEHGSKLPHGYCLLSHATTFDETALDGVHTLAKSFVWRSRACGGGQRL